MRKLILALVLAVQFNPFGIALAAEEVCSRETFTHEELSNPYSSIKKRSEKYSEAESQRIAQAISRNAKEETNSFHRPCLPNTTSCFGHDRAWTYRKELILDNFGNPLRYTGEIASKQFANWPAGKYYAHQTRVGYSCSWGGKLKPQCEKWCSLVVNHDSFHD